MSETSVAHGSRLTALYAVEDNWASSSLGTVYNLRCTGLNINLAKNSFSSNELSSRRQVQFLRHGLFNVAGDVPFEFSYESYDDFLASAFFSSWSSANTLEIGTTQSSLTLQKGFSAQSMYQEFKGCVVNSLSLSIQPDSIITGSFGIMGKTINTYSSNGGFVDGAAVGTDNTASRELSSGVDKSNNQPFDSFSGAIYEGGTSSSDEIAVITGIDLSLENNIEAMNVVGSQTAIGLAEQIATITGTVNAYFSTSSLLEKFIQETSSLMKFTLTDPSDNQYAFLMNNIKYTGGDTNVDGPGPVSISLPFQALDDDTYTSLQITKI